LRDGLNKSVNQNTYPDSHAGLMGRQQHIIDLQIVFEVNLISLEDNVLWAKIFIKKQKQKTKNPPKKTNVEQFMLIPIFKKSPVNDPLVLRVVCKHFSIRELRFLLISVHSNRSCKFLNVKCQEHPTDPFGKLSVKMAFNPLRFSKENCHLELSWDQKFNVCCFRIDKSVVFGTEKTSAMIFGKAIRPKIFGKWTKKP